MTEQGLEQGADGCSDPCIMAGAEDLQPVPIFRWQLVFDVVQMAKIAPGFMVFPVSEDRIEIGQQYPYIDPAPDRLVDQ